MLLQLDRPVVFLDLETTGVVPRVDRIVEIAAIKLHPDGRRERWVKRINPQRAIPAEATAIHGIRDEDVVTAPTFAEIAFDLHRFLGQSDFAGFGIIKFDLPMLVEEFRRADITFVYESAALVDAQRIYHAREPRTLSAALRFYCGQEHTGAHGAEADVLATMAVLEGQFTRYDDLPRDVAGLQRQCQPAGNDQIDAGGKLKWRGDDVVLGFGQKQGMSLRELAKNESNYLRWMLNKDFSPDVKAIIRDALDGKFPKRPTAALVPPVVVDGV